MTKKLPVKKKSLTKQQIPIDWREVDKYLVAGAKGSEVAAALGISYDTLALRCKQDYNQLFSEYTAKKRQKGDSLLHVKQFQVAMSGNTTMLVWLGKQRLNQTDQPRNAETFNGSLAGLLDVMHMIKSADDFATIVNLANKNIAQKTNIEEA